MNRRQCFEGISTIFVCLITRGFPRGCGFLKDHYMASSSIGMRNGAKSRRLKCPWVFGFRSLSDRRVCGPLHVFCGRMDLKRYREMCDLEMDLGSYVACSVHTRQFPYCRFNIQRACSTAPFHMLLPHSRYRLGHCFGYTANSGVLRWNGRGNGQDLKQVSYLT